MKKNISLLLLLISLFSYAQAVNHYVSDNLYTYIHSGPGLKFKIVGSVNAGDKITVLERNKEAGFTKIKDSRGRVAWVRSIYVSAQVGIQERFNELQKDFARLQQATTTLEKKLQIKSNKVNELEKSNSLLQEELRNFKILNEELNKKLDNEQNELLMRWFSYGGMVGGIGLLLGLILPSMMPDKRRKNRW